MHVPHITPFVPQAWVLVHRLHHLYRRNLVLAALRPWAGFTRFIRGVRHRVGSMQAAWRRRRLTDAMASWAAEAASLRRRRAAEAEVAQRHRCARECAIGQMGTMITIKV